MNQPTNSHAATASLKSEVGVTQSFTSPAAQIHSPCRAQELPGTNILIAGAMREGSIQSSWLGNLFAE